MEVWNKNDISMPPNNSVKMKKEDVDIIHLRSVLNGALKAMEEKHLLHTEAAFLSRALFKQHRLFRGQKGIMHMYKVSRGLKRYLSLDLQYVYSNFCKTISCVEDINDEYVYVPTKQMLQYVLVRTQGFCKIMNYLSVACQNAAHYFLGVIKLGHLLRPCLVSVSLVSRIWFCSRYFMICGCQWYDQLLPYLEKLKMKGPSWLPMEYKFPENLGTWFGSDSITGELKYDIDIQKIGEEMSQTEDFKDEGILVSRGRYNADRKKKAGIFVGESVKTSFINLKGKLGETTNLNAELMVNEMKCTSEIGIKPIENCAKYLNDKEVENKSGLVTKTASNSMTFQNDFGEQITRDQFLAQKAKKKSVSTTSCEDPKDIPEKLVWDNQKLLLGTGGNDTGESCAFINGVMSKREKNMQLKKGLCSPVKLNKIKPSTSKVIFEENISNEGRQTSVANKYCSSKTLTGKFCSLDVSQGKEKKLHFTDNSASKVLDVDIKKKMMDTSLNCMQMENEIIESIQSSISSNDNEGIMCKLEFDSNAEHISGVNEQQCAINSAIKKRKKSSLGNWEIINGIRTLKDAKEFLLREKKARIKGKSCVTSQLNGDEWVVLFESINKHLKKNKVSKLKGKRLKPVMEEIRNTLISFVI